MPEVSRFYGIVITMYPEAGERHSTPHFHARYGEHRVTVAIRSGDPLAGSLPRAQMRLVMAWAELHRPELEAAWGALISGQSAHKIAPLR
jgi:hypothetical protein